MVFSASAVFSRDVYGDSLHILKRQLFWLAAGIGFCLVGARVDYHRWRRWCRPLLLGGAGLLLLLFLPGLGRSGGGARRWLSLGGFNFQPAELVKYLMIIYLADFLARKQEVIAGFRRGFLPPLAVVTVLAALVVVQPDLGTALSLGAVGWAMLFLAGARIRHLLLPLLPALPGIAYLVWSKPYRVRRLVAFLDPWQDSRGAGFQIIQSLIALGSGGVTGVGLGESRQKLFYLPAATTDFIFSILGEELGFLGAAAVLVLYAALIFTGFAIARQAADLYGRLLALGIVLMLGLQALVNMAVASSLLPTKGLPLPFISYGGSNLICSFFGIGILLNIAAHRDRPCAAAAGLPDTLFLNRPTPKGGTDHE